jgi:hypothetical protein
MSCVTKKIVMRSASHSSSRKHLHVLARLGIERAEGLVHQQDLRPLDQRLRDRDALLHPTESSYGYLSAWRRGWRARDSASPRPKLRAAARRSRSLRGSVRASMAFSITVRCG